MKKLMLLAALSLVFFQTAVAFAASDQVKSDAIIVTTTFVPGS